MTPTAPLSAQRQRQLRALGHHLNPIILVGDSGVSEGVVTETTRALEDHELIKIRTPAGIGRAGAPSSRPFAKPPSSLRSENWPGGASLSCGREAQPENLEPSALRSPYPLAV